MSKKEMYTREEVEQWVINFVQERIAAIKHNDSNYEVEVDDLGDILVQFRVDDMLTKYSATVLQGLLEHYHEQWLSFYQEHYSGLALMNRTHDSLAYYYEAWYYFCRPGTYKLDL